MPKKLRNDERVCYGDINLKKRFERADNINHCNRIEIHKFSNSFQINIQLFWPVWLDG